MKNEREAERERIHSTEIRYFVVVAVKDRKDRNLDGNAIPIIYYLLKVSSII